MTKPCENAGKTASDGSSLSLKCMPQQEVHQRTDSSRTRDRHDPCRNHLVGDTPVDSAETLRPAHAHDGAGDDMRGRNRKMQHGRRENDEGRIQICRKTIDRLHAENFISDSTDDAPAADTGTGTHRRRARHFDFPRHLERADIAARQQCRRRLQS